MKLLELDIEHFGVFSGQRFEFGGDGFELIYGPNEAGKSTLLQLVREVLFGFPMRNPYAWEKHGGEMAVTASVEWADGERAQYRRRKGRKDPVVGKIESSGRQINAEDLSALLGGASPDLYEQLFGFSLTELSAGEKSLQHSNLTEALFGGGLGGLANFQQLQEGMKSEHESLFSPTATKRTINRQLSEIRETGKALRESLVKPQDYQQLLASSHEADDKVQSLQTRLDELRGHDERLRKLCDAADPAKVLLKAEQELTKLPPAGDFPKDGAAQYRTLVARRDEVQAELAAAERELATACEQLENVKQVPEILEREKQLRELQQQVDKIRGFRRDIPIRKQESQTIKDLVIAKIHKINPDWDLADLCRFKTSLAQRDAFERSKEEHQTLGRREEQLQSRQQSLARDMETLQAKNGEAEVIESVDVLEKTLARSHQYTAWQEQLATLVAERTQTDRRITTLTAELQSPLTGDCDLTEPLPVPMEKTVAEFRRRFGETEKEVDRTSRALQQVERELEKQRASVDRDADNSAIPTKQKLFAARMQRDQAWNLLRRLLVEAEAVSDDEIRDWQDSLPTEMVSLSDSHSAAKDPRGHLLSVFDRLQSLTDEMADQRFENAESIAKQEQLREEQAKLEHAVRDASTRLKSARCRDTALEQEWQDHWTDCKLRPLAPDAMQDWLRSYAELCERREHLTFVEQKIADLENQARKFEAELQQAIGDFEGPGEELLQAARRRANKMRDLAAQRETLQSELSRKMKELAALEQELSQLSGQREAWQQGWKGLLTECGYPDGWDIALATKVVNSLGEAQREYEQAESLDQRIGQMQGELSEFELKVRGLCDTLASELLLMPAENAIVELNQWLEEAKQAERDRQRLQQEQTKLEDRIKVRKTQGGEIRQRLDELMECAKTNDEEQFLQLAEREQRRQTVIAVKEQSQREIALICGSEDDAAFQSELDEFDENAIAAKRGQLAEHIKSVHADYTQALRAAALESERLETLSGASKAADLSADLQTQYSQLRSAVDRWAPLVMARLLLKNAIQKFEQEHQPKMLADVAKILNQMTQGRYVSIQRKLDKQGTLQVVQHDGHVKEPTQLSTGTREQLYLAIRLAYILHYCRESEPLPLVMDDVLVNFDDARARQTLEVLQQVSEQVQIIFLTCHQRVVDLYTEMRPSQSITELPQASELADTLRRAK